MVDIVDKATRSRMMAGIKGKNTKPEMTVRRSLHAAGYRYRLHVKDLPGSPDIVLPKYSAVIFVHGCFWHGHNCRLFKVPTTRKTIWIRKIDSNRLRDASVIQELLQAGWRVLSVWECAFKGSQKLSPETAARQFTTWLHSTISSAEIRGRLG